MNLFGNWSNPLVIGKEIDLESALRVLDRFNNRCQYCRLVVNPTPHTPLGHFVICNRNTHSNSEPSNWVCLCEMCADLNSLDNLNGKGSFIELGWAKQGQINALLRVSYSVALRESDQWGDLKKASERFLNAIDTRPESWSSIGWDGEPSRLAEMMNQMIWKPSSQAYLHKLRFRFDLAPYEDAIRFWAASVESRYTNSFQALNVAAQQLEDGNGE
ncbi:hypothetical protein [uncultured Amphritea sp.]|uniref:HNH endonuclease n=1 Tax=uncultured Amphritea sp. TaxID=981605 RepID=UPI00262E01F8|nr:hypothetical protein [uncultured Amphritea sp.]